MEKGNDESKESEQVSAFDLSQTSQDDDASVKKTPTLKQTVSAKVNGSDKVKLKTNLICSAEKVPRQVSADEKVCKTVEKDERRVAPLIIRTPKLTSTDKETFVDKTRLPAKLINKNQPPTSPTSNCNGDSSNVDVERQRSKPLKKSKSSSSSSPSKSDDGQSKHLSAKRRKREFVEILVCLFA